jgi:hypothetical protein
MLELAECYYVLLVEEGESTDSYDFVIKILKIWTILSFQKIKNLYEYFKIHLGLLQYMRNNLPHFIHLEREGGISDFNCLQKIL